MSKSRNGKIQQYKRPIQINLGMIFFAVILIYIIICIGMYFSSKKVIGYQVKNGSLSETNVYEGIAFRTEQLVTSDYAGYINYFAREGEKVGCNNTVCAIDETGQLLGASGQTSDEKDLLSEKDLSEIKNEVVDFSNSYSKKDFSGTYDFKYAIQGNVLKFTNRNLLNNLVSLENDDAKGFINICKAPVSGIVVYSKDGYENYLLEDVNEKWFAKEDYKKEQLINNEIVDKGDPIYKLATQEEWYILIETDENRAKQLVEEQYIQVKFLKNQYESWAKADLISGKDKKTYIKLTFNNSMLTFATDRFVNIELITSAENGLKVPNSAIVEKEFFIIPSDYVTKGGNANEDGVLRETYLEDGSMIPEFVPVTIYNQKDNEYYIDDQSLRVGDTLDKPDSTETSKVSKSGSLIGVYNINKGYADFKQINILNQNDEYAIIQSNTKYGLVTYDYIVLDAQSVKENDFIYE